MSKSERRANAERALAIKAKHAAKESDGFVQFVLTAMFAFTLLPFIVR